VRQRTEYNIPNAVVCHLKEIRIRMKFHSRKLLLILSAWTPLSMIGLALAAAPTAQPATWIAHDLNVDLHNLPQRYYCDELRQKFRDVLLALGARPDPNVLTSRCEIGSRSPSVRVQFSMPEVLERNSKGGAVVQVAAAIVRLEPGHPVSLRAGDCELLRQIKDGLLTAVFQSAMNFNLACSAPSVVARFNLSVQTLQPLDNGARVALN
jgi:hypothetical protein